MPDLAPDEIMFAFINFHQVNIFINSASLPLTLFYRLYHPFTPVRRLQAAYCVPALTG